MDLEFIGLKFSETGQHMENLFATTFLPVLTLQKLRRS